MAMKVALIGRPNVGKSTLFNRLTGRKLALVHDRPGMTRDRRYGHASLSGLHFELIDTAGLADPEESVLTQSMYQQTQKAIEDADILLFMIDGRVSCTPYDGELAHLIRRYNKPTCVLANKIEGHEHLSGLFDAMQLGFDPVLAVSAEHGLGLDDLYSFLKPHIPQSHLRQEEQAPPPLRLAIMGRPNVGKSTLVNALLKEERQLTGDIPGLTHDAIRICWQYKDRAIQLIDTAGIRRIARVDTPIEHLSVQDARKALQYAECVILVIDSTQALEKQDLALAYEIYNEGRAMVIALNKWDLVKNKTAFLEEVRHTLTHQLAQAKEIPFIGISAARKQGLDKLMEAVFLADQMWNKRVSTAKLNEWLKGVVERHPAPAIKGRRIRPKYITQAKSRPPTFVLFCSQAEKLPESYTRYLINSLRETFVLQGVPIRFWVRGQKNPYSEKHNTGAGKQEKPR